MTRTLRKIGYWATSSDSSLPDPNTLGRMGSDDEVEFLADYLRRGMYARSYLGYSLCRICGEQNGNLEFSDGTYLWPEGLAHYVQEHRIALPDEFVAHATSLTEELEDAEADLDWWRAQHGGD